MTSSGGHGEMAAGTERWSGRCYGKMLFACGAAGRPKL